MRVIVPLKQRLSQQRYLLGSVMSGAGPARITSLLLGLRRGVDVLRLRPLGHGLLVTRVTVFQK